MRKVVKDVGLGDGQSESEAELCQFLTTFLMPIYVYSHVILPLCLMRSASNSAEILTCFFFYY